MPEQEPAPSRKFDDQAIAETLGTRPATVRDVAYGEGVQYSVGRGDARLEVFPRTGVTRLTARDVRVELFGSAVTDVSPGGVEFSRTQPGQDASLTVVPGGGIVFTLVAGGDRTRTVATEPDELLPAPPPLPSAPTTPLRPPRSQDLASPTPIAPPPAAAAPGASSAAREPGSPVTGERPDGRQAAAETKRKPISLTGRLGQDPTFRTTKTGSLVGRFPLAVHREDGHTTWHTVLAFGPYAEQLQRRLASGELTQGREVDIIGYPHVNTRPGKDGTPRTVQEVYAVAVKKR